MLTRRKILILVFVKPTLYNIFSYILFFNWGYQRRKEIQNLENAKLNININNDINIYYTVYIHLL